MYNIQIWDINGLLFIHNNCFWYIFLYLYSYIDVYSLATYFIYVFHLTWIHIHQKICIWRQVAPSCFLYGNWPTADLYYTIEGTNHSKIVLIYFFVYYSTFIWKRIMFLFHYSFNCKNQTYCIKTFHIPKSCLIVGFLFVKLYSCPCSIPQMIEVHVWCHAFLWIYMHVRVITCKLLWSNIYRRSFTQLRTHPLLQGGVLNNFECTSYPYPNLCKFGIYLVNGS